MEGSIRKPPQHYLFSVSIKDLKKYNISASYLQTNPRERRVVICENIYFPEAFREALAQLLIEKYKVYLHFNIQIVIIY